MSQQINLFNPIFLKQQKHFSLPTMLQGLGLVLLGSLLFFVFAKYQVAQLEQQSAESTKRFEIEQARLVRYTAEYSPQQAYQLLQDELQQLEIKVTEANELVDTLRSGAVGNTTGYSEYLRAFARQATAGLWLTSFDVTGDAAQISLSGGVTDPELLPVYIQKLSRESVMHGKKFSTLQMQQPKVDTKSADKNAAPRYVEFALRSDPESEAKQ
ncbi:MAG: fimbrial assembly protein [Gallionella sp.]